MVEALLPVRGIDARQRFEQLASTWETETRFLSDPGRMILHPAYQQIIGMGMGAVPLILARLAQRPDHWFWALRSITGESPVISRGRGMKHARQAWLRWGRERGYLPATTTGPPVVIVLHGPSGVGKDSVIDALRSRSGIHRATSSTSRPCRDGERDGDHYHFLSREAFEQKIAAGDFIEYAQVYGDWKGLERSEFLTPLTEGRDVIIRTDVQGARTWREKLEGAIYIFLTAEDRDALRARLVGRGSEDVESVAKRIGKLEEELADEANNDYSVVNRDGRLEDAVAEIEEIIERERHNPERLAPRVRE